MKVVLEIKGKDRTTKYSADLSKMGESAKGTTEKIGSFFEQLFAGVFTKETQGKPE